MSSWTVDMRRALIVLALPLASFFGVLPESGSVKTAVELSVEAADQSGNLPAPLYLNPSLFPSDVCANLDNGKYNILDRDATGKIEKCFYQSEAKCGYSTSSVLLKLGKAVVTTTGAKVSYDVCVWDPTYVKKNGQTGACRNAALSYYCHTSCSGVPQGRARTASSATGIKSKSKTKLVRSQGGPSENGRFPFAEVSYTSLILTYGRRQLAVSPPVPKAEKAQRQLVASCPGTEVKMENGNMCCEIDKQPLDLFDSDDGPITNMYFKAGFTPAGKDLTVGSENQEGGFTEGLGFQVVQTCKYKGGNECECTESEGDPVLGADLLCDASPPVPWGIDGYQ